MAEKELPPIIVIKKIKKGAHGAHGGAWKIAYADFVTAMMAFFLLMWVLGSTTSGDLAGISAYFQNPLRLSLNGGKGSGDTSRMIAGGGDSIMKAQGQDARADADTDQRRVSDSSVTEVEKARKYIAKMEVLKEDINQELSTDPELAKVKSQVFMDVTTEGLRIQLVDEKMRPMFSAGSADLAPYTRSLLRLIGRVMAQMNNKVRIEGHTDGMRYGNGPAGTGNWELSTERANAARREMVAGGLNEGNIAQVVGYADTIRMNPDNPSDPLNRRISIMIQHSKLPPPSSVGFTPGSLPVEGGGSQLPAPGLAPQSAAPAGNGRVPALELPSRPMVAPVKPAAGH